MEDDVIPKKRKSLSRKIRFEVFKRDSFTCQYCGAKAPDKVLEVDHIHPVVEQGSDDLLNLITSCFECNSGKSDRLLSDSTVVEKKMKQAEDLQARREMIEMVSEWQLGLLDIETEYAAAISRFWEKLTGEELPIAEAYDLVSSLQKYGDQFYKAVRWCAVKNSTRSSDCSISENIKRACRAFDENEKNPELAKLYYIRGIIRKRFPECNERDTIIRLKNAFDETVERYGKEEVLYALEVVAKTRQTLSKINWIYDDMPAFFRKCEERFEQEKREQEAQ